MSDALVAMLPADARAEHALPSFDDEQFRGRALFNVQRHDAAAAVFSASAERVGVDPALACTARVSQLRALSRLRERRAELVALGDRVLRDCSDPESRVWSHYYTAQAMVRLGDPTSALLRYDQIAIDAPGHSLVDDALFKGAQVATDVGDAAGAEVRLRLIVNQHADGDMRALARFDLAWRLRRSGDHVGALRELDTLIAEGAGESGEGVAGRAQYWRARSLAQLNRAEDAIAGFRLVVLTAPLSYYGQQALARLSELRPALAVELAATIATSADRLPLLFRARPELREPAFQRAMELLAVGEIDRARQELSWCGALGEGADPELLWLVAALFDAAHAPEQANRIARDRLRAFTATAPRGRGYGMWRLAYPLAFAPVIDDAAAESGVPATFVRAVAREESAFDPNAVSSAGAHGLIQLMEATAREHAKALKLPSDPAALHRPEVNVRIGASFMRYLWKRYAENSAVVPAAYNAGHGAADRWLSERPDHSLDEWIENIPYDETRRYTRRVLQSYGVYAMLDEGRLPTLRALLPHAP
jgi:soluble lytic murein transglycosylase